jgi:hypothetical protein
LLRLHLANDGIEFSNIVCPDTYTRHAWKNNLRSEDRIFTLDETPKKLPGCLAVIKILIKSILQMGYEPKTE